MGSEEDGDEDEMRSKMFSTSSTAIILLSFRACSFCCCSCCCCDEAFVALSAGDFSALLGEWVRGLLRSGLGVLRAVRSESPLPPPEGLVPLALLPLLLLLTTGSASSSFWMEERMETERLFIFCARPRLMSWNSRSLFSWTSAALLSGANIWRPDATNLSSRSDSSLPSRSISLR